MRKKIPRKPGPKSVTQSKIMNKRGTLGETSCESEDNTTATEFQTPEIENDMTDYGLEFTRTSPRRCSTLNLAPVRPISSARSIQSTPPETSQQVAKKSTGKHHRKQKTPLRADQRFWKEVQQLQTREYLIPLLPFSRLVRELMISCSTEVTKITRTALGALQTSSEMYLTQILQDAYMLTLHRQQVTLAVKDLQLMQLLKSNMY